MPGLLTKIARLSDEQLIEGERALADEPADELRFVREAVLMEYENRHGVQSTKGDLPGHPF